MIGGYPPKANINKREEIKVFFIEKDVCDALVIKAIMTIAFQLRQGITRKEKYMNDRMYGVIVLNSENSTYDNLLRGMFQYLARREMPRE
jgi:hypothetical protein